MSCRRLCANIIYSRTNTHTDFFSDLNNISYVWANILCFAILMAAQINMDDHSSISSLLGGKFSSHTQFITECQSERDPFFSPVYISGLLRYVKKNLCAIVLKLSFVKKIKTRRMRNEEQKHEVWVKAWCGFSTCTSKYSNKKFLCPFKGGNGSYIWIVLRKINSIL